MFFILKIQENCFLFISQKQVFENKKLNRLPNITLGVLLHHLVYFRKQEFYSTLQTNRPRKCPS